MTALTLLSVLCEKADLSFRLAEPFPGYRHGEYELTSDMVEPVKVSPLPFERKRSRSSRTAHRPLVS
jgi:hypothetical protein